MKKLQRLTTAEENQLIGRMVVSERPGNPILYFIIVGIKKYENRHMVLECYNLVFKKTIEQDWGYKELKEILSKKILKHEDTTEYLI